MERSGSANSRENLAIDWQVDSEPCPCPFCVLSLLAHRKLPCGLAADSCKAVAASLAAIKPASCHSKACSFDHHQLRPSTCAPARAAPPSCTCDRPSRRLSKYWVFAGAMEPAEARAGRPQARSSVDVQPFEAAAEVVAASLRVSNSLHSDQTAEDAALPGLAAAAPAHSPKRTPGRPAREKACMVCGVLLPEGEVSPYFRVSRVIGARAGSHAYARLPRLLVRCTSACSATVVGASCR